MRVGLVGVGRFGRRYLDTLAGMPEFQLLAVASRNAGTDALLPAGCQRFGDWRELVALPGLQGVFIVTPPASHAAIVSAAVEQGLAVLVEKPLTLDVAEAEMLRVLPANAPVMVEHTHLFSPAYALLRDRVADTRIRRIEVNAGGPGPWRSDVGVLWDWGAHWVAVCLDLLGRSPTTSSCSVDAERRVNGGIGQRIIARLDFGDNVQARLELDNLLDTPCRRLTVNTEDGRVLTYEELQPEPLTERIDAGSPIALAVPATLPLAAALGHFETLFSDWQAGRTPRCRSDLALGVEVVRVLAACESAGGLARARHRLALIAETHGFTVDSRAAGNTCRPFKVREFAVDSKDKRGHAGSVTDPG